MGFFGDPDYKAPPSRVALDRAATAPKAGPDDPLFYAMAGDDVETAFQGASPEVSEAASGVAQWLRTEPEKGKKADMKAFRTQWTALATACAPASAAAAWTAKPGKNGTKPAALVCSDIADTPSTLNHFANANVLTSNMFYLVGRVPQTVPSARMDDVAATEKLLTQEAAWVDDDGVREAIGQIKKPFTDALAGDTYSPGLQKPLEVFGEACTRAGYPIGGFSEGDPGQGSGEDGGLV